MACTTALPTSSRACTKTLPTSSKVCTTTLPTSSRACTTTLPTSSMACTSTLPTSSRACMTTLQTSSRVHKDTELCMASITVSPSKGIFECKLDKFINDTINLAVQELLEEMNQKAVRKEVITTKHSLIKPWIPDALNSRVPGNSCDRRSDFEANYKDPLNMKKFVQDDKHVIDKKLVLGEPGDRTPSLIEDTDKELKDLENDGIDVEDSFVKLLLQKGIKVGNHTPQNNKKASEQKAIKQNDCIDDMFERFAAKSGIRIGQSVSHPSTTASSPSFHVNNASELDLMDDSSYLNNVTTNHSQINASSKVVQANDVKISQTITTKKVLSFEELARRHGIKVGLEKVDALSQTDACSVTSQESQTLNPIKMQHVAVQVDIDKEAFKGELNEWIQEELSALDSTGSSYRKLYMDECSARSEAENRLNEELDKKVKSQRSMKMSIDELKQQLQDKKDAIEKMIKEHKRVKKHKDNEIKKLTKEVKQYEEEIVELKHEIQLKEVAIDAINEISRSQASKIEELEHKLKALEDDMEKEIKKNSAFKLEPAKVYQPPKSEWQVVRGRNYKSAVRLPHQMDTLSGFDDDVETYNPQTSIHDSSDDSLNCTESRGSIGYMGLARSRTQSQGSDGTCSTESRGNVVQTGLTRSRRQSQGYDGNVGHTGLTRSRTPSQDSECSKELLDRSDALIDEPCTGHSHDTSPISLTSMGNNVIDMYNCNQDEMLSKTQSSLPPPGLNACRSTLVDNLGGSIQASGIPFQGPASLDTFTTAGGIASSSINNTSNSFIFGGGISTYLPPMMTKQYQEPCTTLPNALPTRKISPTKVVTKSNNNFSSFDKLMESLRDRFPDYSRPLLMVYLKKAKDSYGNTGFKGKEISEIVSRVAQIIKQGSF